MIKALNIFFNTAVLFENRCKYSDSVNILTRFSFLKFYPTFNQEWLYGDIFIYFSEQ